MQQQTVLPTPTRATSAVQHQIAAVEKWDMAQEKRYMVNKFGITPERADRLETEFKRYLVLCAIHNDSFPISKPVDEIWHVALLDHVKYAGLEESAGRRFIHRMTLSAEDDQALLPLYHSRTLPRYMAEFGESANEELWPRDHCVCTCCDCIEVIVQ